MGPEHAQADHPDQGEEGELPRLQPAARGPHGKGRAAADQPQSHPGDQATLAQARHSRQPPQHHGNRAHGVDHRQPVGDVLRPEAQHAPDRRQFEHPQEVGVALHVLAGIEDQAMPVEQVAHIAEANEGVIGDEPRHARQPAQQCQPRKQQQHGDDLAGTRRPYWPSQRRQGRVSRKPAAADIRPDSAPAARHAARQSPRR